MTKEETVLLKGVALLMMLGCHLGSGFGINFIHIGGIPLYDIINRIDVPVQIFTILGGYGLFYVFRRVISIILVESSNFIFIIGL